MNQMNVFHIEKRLQESDPEFHDAYKLAGYGDHPGDNPPEEMLLIGTLFLGAIRKGMQVTGIEKRPPGHRIANRPSDDVPIEEFVSNASGRLLRISIFDFEVPEIRSGWSALIVLEHCSHDVERNDRLIFSESG